MKTRLEPLLRLWEWQSEAACRGMDSSVFFTPHGERGPERRQREEAAYEICRRCPVRLPCADFAEASNQHYGVWGGRTEAERRTAAPTQWP